MSFSGIKNEGGRITLSFHPEVDNGRNSIYLVAHFFENERGQELYRVFLLAQKSGSSGEMETDDLGEITRIELENGVPSFLRANKVLDLKVMAS